MANRRKPNFAVSSVGRIRSSPALVAARTEHDANERRRTLRVVRVGPFDAPLCDAFARLAAALDGTVVVASHVCRVQAFVAPGTFSQPFRVESFVRETE